jgi:hypothetical protein
LQSLPIDVSAVFHNDLAQCRDVPPRPLSAAEALATMPTGDLPVRLNAPIIPPLLRHLLFWLMIETGRLYRYIYCPTYVTSVSSRESSVGVRARTPAV